MTDEDGQQLPGPRAVTGPQALRGLSHPLRLRILAELASRGPHNVSMLAERLGEPANSVSYHLAQLAKHEFVVRVDAPEGATRRERWYDTASPTGFALTIDGDTPDQVAAATAVRTWMVQTSQGLIDLWIANDAEAQRRDLPQGKATLGVWLTRDEALEANRRLEELLRPLGQRFLEQRGKPAPEDGHEYYWLETLFFPDLGPQPGGPAFWDKHREGLFE